MAQPRLIKEVLDFQSGSCTIKVHINHERGTFKLKNIKASSFADAAEYAKVYALAASFAEQRISNKEGS